MMKLGARLRLAWAGFRLQRYEIRVAPYHETSRIGSGATCDRQWRSVGSAEQVCAAPAVVCISQGYARIEVTDDEDHWHVCDPHARELLSGRPVGPIVKVGGQ